MANRYFEQFALSLEKGKVFLFGKFAVGATGAATIDAANSKGIASISRTALGKYTITLSDTYNKLFNIQPMVLLASGTPAAPMWAVVSEAVATSKTIVIQFLDAAGAAAELDNGAQVRFTIILKNSSV